MKKINKEKDFVPLSEQLVFPLYLCSKEVLRVYDTLLKKIDLTYTQYIVMQYFWEKKTSNVKELGKIMLLDSSTLTTLLKKLEKKGLVTRTKSSIDERNLVVELTEKGMNLKKEALELPKEMEKICGLNEQEANDMRNMACKLLNNIEEEMKK